MDRRTRPGISRSGFALGAPRNDELKNAARLNSCPSIRLRQAQHPLGYKAEDELRADRCDAGDEGFPQIALDMEFLGITEAAVRHHGLLAGVKASLGGEIFRRVRRWAAWHALVVLPGG